MKTFRVARACDPARLHAELLALGVPVVTVRGSYATSPDKEPSMYAIVVTEDSAPPNTMALIALHVEARQPSKTPKANEREASMAEMEKL